MAVYLAIDAPLSKSEESTNPRANMRFDHVTQSIHFTYVWTLACEPVVKLKTPPVFSRAQAATIRKMTG